MCKLVLLIRHTHCRACGSDYEHPEGLYRESMPEGANRLNHRRLHPAAPEDVFFRPKTIERLSITVDACQACFAVSILQPDLFEWGAALWALEDKRPRRWKRAKPADGGGASLWDKLGL